MTDRDWEMVGLSRARRSGPETIVDGVDVARALQVHPRTVQRWILSGRLRGHRKGNVRSRWRVYLDDLGRAYWEAGSNGGKRMLETMIRAGLRAARSAPSGSTSCPPLETAHTTISYSDTKD